MKNAVIEQNQLTAFQKFKLYMKYMKGVQLSKTHIVVSNQLVQVEEAPEPGDIIWENQKFKTHQKINLRTKSNIYTILLVCCCIVGIGAIKMLQSYFKKNKSNINVKVVKFLSIFISIVIACFNKFYLAIFTRKIVGFSIFF